MDQSKTPLTPRKRGHSPDQAGEPIQGKIAKMQKVMDEMREEKIIAEKKKILAERDKAIAEFAKLKKYSSKTNLVDYLGVVNERVYSNPTVELNRSRPAPGTTCVAGQYCPRYFRFWKEFEGLHDETFQELEDKLSPLEASFPSPLEVSNLVSVFGPTSRWKKERATLRPFLRIGLEKPAVAIVNQYLYAASGVARRRTPRHVYFTDDDIKTRSSFPTSSFTPGMGVSSNPDRICMYNPNDAFKVGVRFLVGEYKSAHRLTAPELQGLLEAPPEDYLVQAADEDRLVPPDDAASDAVFSDKHPPLYLAKALVQTYHYMIAGAIEYGYIATGNGLIMLHVVPDDLDTLYYYRVACSLDQTPVSPKTTAAAYMSTLILLALRHTPSSDSRILDWTQGRMVWPSVRYSGTGITGPTVRTSTEDRSLAFHLPYCTQACLLGIVHQRPLDDQCPNVERHRAASLKLHGTPDRHPLTAVGLRKALRLQSKAAETDVTQQCYPAGRQGRYGALVRVAVVSAGYGLVAKATYVNCLAELEHERRIYDALAAYQGTLIPVCFGIETYWSGRFTTDGMMRSLLFLSYAGCDLGKPERLPLNVDLQAAMDRTAKELCDLGLRNDDVRVYNCAWNPETRRVMHFGFDQATMVDWEMEQTEETEETEELEETADENGTITENRPLAFDLPYCTQACLLGIVHQHPLDDQCPNVERHRAASLKNHGSPDRHPLTEAGLRKALRLQAKAAETDFTQQCSPSGQKGRDSELVRVAVTCAGYGLVAKATYVDCVDELEHELNIYNALKACQGRLIPVCFGIETYWSGHFTTDCMKRSLLFLSYAGHELEKAERLPLNVDLQAAMDRTTKELYDLGLRNDDMRANNCAWNPETGRVMHFGFDQAAMVDSETKETEETAGDDGTQNTDTPAV